MLREQIAHLPRASQRGRTDLLNYCVQPGPLWDGAFPSYSAKPPRPSEGDSEGRGN